MNTQATKDDPLAGGGNRAGPASLMDLFLKIQAIASLIVKREENPEVTLHAMAIIEAALSGQQRAHLSSLPINTPSTEDSIKLLVTKVREATRQIQNISAAWKKQLEEIRSITGEIHRIVCG